MNRFPHPLHRENYDADRERDNAERRAEARREEQWVRESLAKVPTSPCECVNWARAVNLKYLTNHHPNCPHYNDSLIDVWKMTVNGVSAYTDSEQEVIDWQQDEFEDKTTITKEKMHREVCEQLPNFEGF